MTERYTATIEMLSSRRAIVALFDSRGDWSGASRIDARDRDELYERGYERARQAASCKGGELDAYRVVEPPRPLPAQCSSRVSLPVIPRSGNVVCLEFGGFPMHAQRCLLKQPPEWRGRGASSLRWVASGGDTRVFGACTSRESCPKIQGGCP